MLTIDVTDQGRGVERLTIRRMSALTEETEDHSYMVVYKRLSGHRTFTGDATVVVYVKHKFADGSLSLIEKAIQGVRKEFVRA